MKQIDASKIKLGDTVLVRLRVIDCFPAEVYNGHRTVFKGQSLISKVNREPFFNEVDVVEHIPEVIFPDLPKAGEVWNSVDFERLIKYVDNDAVYSLYRIRRSPDTKWKIGMNHDFSTFMRFYEKSGNPLENQ